MPDPDLARFPPPMWDKSWTYVDCYDRYYRYKNTHSPYTCYGEHNQIKIGGWSVETWDLTYKWIKYENLATEEEVNDLINTLKRNAERRRKLYEQASNGPIPVCAQAGTVLLHERQQDV